MASAAAPAPASEHLSAAQKLAQEHAEHTAEGHHVTVEDVVDEDLTPHHGDIEASNTPALSEKASGKQKETSPAATALDTQSRELFPDLGGPKSQATTKTVPKWNVLADKTNGQAQNGTSRAATPSSGAATPTGNPAVPSVSLPGRKNVETIALRPQHMKPREQLRRPLPDIIKDINRTSRANISIASTSNGITFEATGPQDAAQRALKELVNQIGTPQTIQVPIPQSARAHIIGKQGSTIKSLQEKTGARIEVPKDEKNGPHADELDDDVYINVKIEGNTISAALAKQEIERIVGERAAKVNAKVRGIPAEFYPFIARSRDDLLSRPGVASGTQMRVPPHHMWSSQATTPAPASGQRPVFQPAAEHHIQLEGERPAVLALKAEIERRAAELREQLLLQQLEIQRGRHQFIIGNSEPALSADEFFQQTGCAILLPTDEDDDAITIIGPADQIAEGLEKAEQLAMSMQMNNVDHLKWTNKMAPGRGAEHSKYVTRYLQQRKEIERLERQYHARINTPFSGNGALPWELYIPQGQKLAAASSDIRGLFESHPPSRMSTLRDVNPFFYPYVQNEIRPHVRENYGVNLVVPESSDPGSPILLVYEAPGPVGSDYEIPRAAPSQEDVRKFQQGLRDAEKHIMELLSQQEEITSETVEVPLKFHDRLKKFIIKEQDKRPRNQTRVRVTQLGANVTLRGPSSAVQNLAEKVKAFVEQEKADEKERDFTLEFDFPQQFANHLIGKGGSNIRELRDKFDVDIQVENGKVQLKGPKAKAASARSHIESLGKNWADETTKTLTVEPKFHRELIGAQGSEINKLQNRYKVLIFFPRAEKSGKDDDANADAASDAGKARRQQAPNQVIIRGPSRGVSEAYDELHELVNWLKTNSYTETVTVQRKQLPSLIGQGGTAMEALRQQTETKIDIPNDRDSSESTVEIQIKGKKDNVLKAKKILQEKKAAFDDTVTKTIDVDRKYHRALIGAQGANLRNMIVEAGGSDEPRERARIIQFPKQEADGNTIKLEGRSEVVDKLIQRIQEFVAHRESQVTTTVDVPTEKHRSLIGRGGDAKRQLESQFNVSIDIPRQGSGETAVKITGQEADVEKAKEHIVNSTKEKPAETIMVPRSLHQSISNGGLFFRRLRNDFQVTVDHAGQTPPPKPTAAPRANGGALPLITDDDEATADVHSWHIVENTSADEEGDIPWVLKGSPENIEKAKEAITTSLEQAKDSVTGFLVLPDPKTYRHVIGQGGSKVNSIRKQSGCKINVPRDQGEAIEVIGTKEGVEKAKDLILAAVRDGVNGSRARE
ncbi:Vigilin 1 [Cytospora mali]|uniref:Vigilin 1 n=1 Tax=Cytospora mali TaxID=578113 RepID=A0A194UP90_CYTMA|nr:Vigilin 1 [Valsa mali var. pyri (nom. inval.)]